MTIQGLAGGKKSRQSGITLLEVLISMVVLTIGLVGMLSVLGVTIKATQASQENSVAKTVADEALESILTARETTTVPWSAIANTGSGGIFLSGYQPVCNAGADGIYGTADDCASGEQTLQLPGPDGIFGTADDVFMPLTNYTRTITITEAIGPPPLSQPIPELNVVTIVVTYQNPQVKVQQNYTLNTYISEYR